MNCSHFNRCHANICPCDSDYKQRKHIQGESICVHLRSLLKHGQKTPTPYSYTEKQAKATADYLLFMLSCIGVPENERVQIGGATKQNSPHIYYLILSTGEQRKIIAYSKTEALQKAIKIYSLPEYEFLCLCSFPLDS